jgi:hypothetical protein
MPLLFLLILVPIAAYRMAKKRMPQHLWAMVGVALGAVISPLSFGLYAFYFISPWGFVLGFIGLLLQLAHGWPGFRAATFLGIIPRGVVTGATSLIIIEVINALIWMLLYGLIGVAVDRFRTQRSLSHEK